MKKKYTKDNVALGFVERISKKYTIIVTSDNNRKHVPCFHVIDYKTCGSQFDCKISLTECRYLKDTKDILTTNQNEELIKLLKTKSSSIFGTKNVWFDYFYCYKISNKNDLQIDTVMPDYRQLKTKD